MYKRLTTTIIAMVFLTVAMIAQVQRPVDGGSSSAGGGGADSGWVLDTDTTSTSKYVGIGITNPLHELDVVGNMRFSSSMYRGAYPIITWYSAGPAFGGGQYSYLGTPTDTYIRVRNTGEILFRTNLNAVGEWYDDRLNISTPIYANDSIVMKGSATTFHMEQADGTRLFTIDEYAGTVNFQGPSAYYLTTFGSQTSGVGIYSQGVSGVASFRPDRGRDEGWGGNDNQMEVKTVNGGIEQVWHNDSNVVKSPVTSIEGSLTIAGDTNVSPIVGRIVFQAADSTFYGCRSAVANKKWYKLNP